MSEVLSSVADWEAKWQTGPDMEIATDTGPIEYTPLAPALRQLEALLQENDTEAVQLIGDIRERPSDPRWRAELDQLEALIGRYNFEGALAFLQTLMEA